MKQRTIEVTVEPDRRHHHRSRRLQGRRLREGHPLPGGSARESPGNAARSPNTTSGAASSINKGWDRERRVLTFKPDGIVIGLYTEAIPLTPSALSKSIG